MDGLSKRRANHLLCPLRLFGLGRRRGEAHVLTEEGLTCLARREISASSERFRQRARSFAVWTGALIFCLAVSCMTTRSCERAAQVRSRLLTLRSTPGRSAFCS